MDVDDDGHDHENNTGPVEVEGSESVVPRIHLRNSSYPLHEACRTGDVESLAALLAMDLFSVNGENYELNRPLHEACLAGHYGCVELLCNHGANVNLRNIDGATALCDACSRGSLEIIELLLHKGAVVNPPFLLISPLHEAALGDNWHCIPTLINHGAKLEASDLDYGTPLHTAVSRCFMKSASILLAAGAQVNACKNHRTPLHAAAGHGYLEMVYLLLEYGADVYLKDARGRRPVDLVPTDKEDVVDLLKQSEDNPRSLRQICRLNIRKCVGVKRLNQLSHLRLPAVVIRYLAYKYFEIEKSSKE